MFFLVKLSSDLCAHYCEGVAMKSTSALEEFLQICEENQMDGSGHSIEVLSTSEGCRSSEFDSPSTSADVLQSEVVPSSGHQTRSGCLKSNGHRLVDDRTLRTKPAVERQEIDHSSASENVVEETPPEEYNAPAAHSTPNPCDDAIGFWINPDEMPDHLKAATIRVAKKYLMK
ncbi:hypothetical protein Y032_0099g3159 [Ancylostoma ceylanicum]|uniref:Uncharacterized protein n=1 Tax=Ancylostoma ceylanicum TaxID=53326 RepID=A0A016TII7_9BILA|nr:hypothetical protein Y032_0099g3159 [Ancylostoma ceylanicum]